MRGPWHRYHAFVSLIRGAVVSIILTMNLFAWGAPFAVVTIIALVPGQRHRLTPILEKIVELWSRSNQWLSDALVQQRWIIEVPDELRPDASYIIVSNHRSWLDIPAIHRALIGRIPFIRFFVKRELLFTPVIGLAAWALEMPLMKRHSGEYLENHPEKRGEDFETARRATRNFAAQPGAILNFVEGTRFSDRKRRNQEGPWKNLLKPKLGGISTIIGVLGDRVEGLVDITITYPVSKSVFWTFVRGKLPWVAVRARLHRIPVQFRSSAVFDDPSVREEFRTWFHGLWSDKDRLIGRDLRSGRPGTADRPER